MLSEDIIRSDDNNMISHHTNSKRLRIIPQDSALVKAVIIANGIACGDLARAARISQSSLSNYIKGIRHGRQTQLQIHRAFCRLAGKKITPRKFWGKLLTKKGAA